MTHDLSEFNKHLGVIPDAAVAELAGCHVNTVAAWRERMGRSSATTLGEPSRAFQLRMPHSLMALIREVDAARVAAGRDSNLSGVIRDALRAGLPSLDV